MSARFPGIPCGDEYCRLPLSKPTADVLLSSFFEPWSAVVAEAFVEALATDPALALWGSYHHARDCAADSRAPSLAALAEWLGKHLFALLNSSENARSADETLAAPEPNRLAARAATDVAAAVAGAGKRKPLEDPLYLTVLLGSLSDEWLKFGGCAKNLAVAWPGWLGIIFRERAAAGTAPAVAASARGKGKAASPTASRARRVAAKKYPAGSLPERARQRWLVSPGFAAQEFCGSRDSARQTGGVGSAVRRAVGRRKARGAGRIRRRSGS